MNTFRHPCGATSLAYRPDGSTLFSADARGAVRAWDLATGNGVVVWRDAPEAPFGIDNLTVSPDGRRILIGSLLCRIGPVPGAEDSLVFHSGPYGRIQLASGWAATRLGGCGAAFSPNSRLIAGFHEALATVCLWKTIDGNVIGSLTYEQMLRNPTFSPDGKTLVTVFSDGVRDAGLALWDVKRLRLRQAERVHYDKIEIDAIPLYSPDGRCLVVASGDKIHLHTVRPRMLSWTGTLRSKSPQHIQTIAFSPDSKRLLTGSKDAIVRLWDVHARQPIAEWDWKIGEVNQVAFAPDGMTAAAAGGNGLLVVWDLDV